MRLPGQCAQQGLLKTQMVSRARQVMEMCEADGCKTVGRDGDCGEPGECLPHPKVFKLKTKHTARTKQKSAGGSDEAARLPFCDLWKKKKT